MTDDPVVENTINTVIAAADRRDELADQRDCDADARDVEAEHDAAIWGVDYSIHDARPFYVRRQAKKDRQAAAADRTAAAADRLLLTHDFSADHHPSTPLASAPDAAADPS